MTQTPRLDILIYAHDGRGLGHASRSIGIGLALRRLYPELRVLFVSGCRFTSELIGRAPLDWLKLPSYETKVVNGTSRGVTGKSMFSDSELGKIRAKEMESLISIYHPRLVLVDHTPQGKHKELVPAVSRLIKNDTLWILGVRGVVGGVSQANSELAGSLFKSHYHGLLWYGDSAVLGKSHLGLLRDQYGVEPVECGYVLRLAEYALCNSASNKSTSSLAGTISVPWLGEQTAAFLHRLATCLARIPSSYGNWHLYIDSGPSPEIQRYVEDLFAGISTCLVESPSGNYMRSLLRSKTAMVFGGYNSVMDVLHSGVSALVVLREMRDEEQQLHLGRIVEVAGEQISIVSESRVTARELEDHLLANLQKTRRFSSKIMVDGASRAAGYLHEMLP